MNARIIYTLKFVAYKLFARHKKGHGIHSPFVFELITKVFRSDDLARQPDQSLVHIIPIKWHKHRYMKMFSVLIGFYKFKNILEIKHQGACGYLPPLPLHGVSKAICIESNGAIVNTLDQVIIYDNNGQDNLFKVLTKALQLFGTIDFIFFNAPTGKEPLLACFDLCTNKIHNNTIIAINHIHGSKEMEKAWNEIRTKDQVILSIDLFKVGLLFFRKGLSREHYVIKF